MNTLDKKEQEAKKLDKTLDELLNKLKIQSYIW